jgi:PAS domain-containing protein
VGDQQEKKTTVNITSFEMNRRNGSMSLGSDVRKGSCTSESSRGPQPLTKNIISEEKMIQLRKKSMDFMEAQKQMRQLNEELGLKHRLAMKVEDDEDEGYKEKKDSDRSDPDSDESSHINMQLHSRDSSPDLDDPFPSLDRNHLKRPVSSSDEEDSRFNLRQTHSSSSVNRSSTFNYGSKVNTDGVPVNIDSDTSERGGSLRITRHSKRARAKVEHIFNKPDPDLDVKADAFPSLNVTPCTPPLRHHPFSESIIQHHEETTDSASHLTNPSERQTGRSSPRPSPRASPNAQRRRRRAGVIPPPIIAPSQSPTPGAGGSDQLQACPFHTSGSSPKPCRRNASPEDGVSPKPVRKKKVSVAQIEATFVPPTPVKLEPPQHLSRSPSFNATRTHDDAFADNAFRSVMQISQDAICCANSVGDIVFWSVGACKMFGYTPGEAIGSSLEVMYEKGGGSTSILSGFRCRS